ncbi:hypothetical protein YC2023_095224 [Brassica napus]
MHPPLTPHRHPLCLEFISNLCVCDCLFENRILVCIIEEFQKCHLEHPIGKFFGECTELKVKLDRCFRQEKAVKRKVNFERSKKLQERLKTIRKEETAET